METAIKLKGINKSFGEKEERIHVLHDISLDVNYGEMTLFVGPSGCGKTTLISIIGAILEPDTGEVFTLNNPIHKMTSDEKTEFRKNNVGFIFQQFNLISTLSVQENVAIPLFINNAPYDFAMQKAKEMLEIMEIGNKAKELPNKLSGGEQQRVAISRALVKDPNLIICDEPTASLDGHTGRKIVELLKKTTTSPDKAVIIVTHDNRIFEYGDKMVKMEDGRINSIDKIRI
jgi:putative ABC transport system ATP-binding protein